MELLRSFTLFRVALALLVGNAVGCRDATAPSNSAVGHWAFTGGEFGRPMRPNSFGDLLVQSDGTYLVGLNDGARDFLYGLGRWQPSGDSIRLLPDDPAPFDPPPQYVLRIIGDTATFVVRAPGTEFRVDFFRRSARAAPTDGAFALHEVNGRRGAPWADTVVFPAADPDRDRWVIDGTSHDTLDVLAGVLAWRSIGRTRAWFSRASGNLGSDAIEGRWLGRLTSVGRDSVRFDAYGLSSFLVPKDTLVFTSNGELRGFSQGIASRRVAIYRRVR